MSRRSGRIRPVDSGCRSTPAKRMTPRLATSLSTAIASVVLPEPDSPTMPQVVPCRTSRLTSSTAWMTLVRRRSNPCQPAGSRNWQFSPSSWSKTGPSSLVSGIGWGMEDIRWRV